MKFHHRLGRTAIPRLAVSVMALTLVACSSAVTDPVVMPAASEPVAVGAEENDAVGEADDAEPEVTDGEENADVGEVNTAQPEDVVAAMDAAVNHFEEGLSVSGVTEIVTEFVNIADDGGAQAEDDEESHTDDEGAQEDQDVPAEGIDVELPATGSDMAQVTPIAALALSVGVLLWLVRRRVSG